MAKELERVGIPTVQICNIVSIAETIGANRIVPGIAIPHPCGDPRVEQEKNVRRDLIERALETLCQDVLEPTIFR
jgi:betaine reductase